MKNWKKNEVNNGPNNTENKNDLHKQDTWRTRSVNDIFNKIGLTMHKNGKLFGELDCTIDFRTKFTIETLVQNYLLIREQN